MVERIINITVEDVCEHYTWKVVAASEEEMAEKYQAWRRWTIQRLTK